MIYLYIILEQLFAFDLYNFKDFLVISPPYTSFNSFCYKGDSEDADIYLFSFKRRTIRIY